jgi:hypothetical protein
MSIDLEAVPQPWLDYPVAALHFENQTLDVRMKIVVDFVEVSCNDGAEEDSPEPRGGIGRQNQVAKRHATRGRDGPRVPDLEFGKEHRARRYWRFRRAASA